MLVTVQVHVWSNLVNPLTPVLPVTGHDKPEICTKMLKKLMSEKLRAKFPATAPGCSMLKVACLDDAFFDVF